MYLYILLDTSGSMEGAKIGALNDSMSNIIIDLQEKAFNGAIINLSVLSFARQVKWMCEQPINILDFEWTPLTACGMTSLGKACSSLCNSIEKYNKENDDIAIVLLSDGCPTDDYDEGLAKLYDNKLFISASKFAIALGDNADFASLSRFSGNAEAVFIENNADKLLDILNEIMNRIPEISDRTESLQNEDPDDEWG